MTADLKTIVTNAAHPSPTRREQLLELLVFLFLIMPSMALSFFVVQQGGLGFWLVASSVILRDLGLMSLVLFFLWRNCEPVGSIGWTLHGLRREVRACE
jgi:hypothetical protein